MGTADVSSDIAVRDRIVIPTLHTFFAGNPRKIARFCKNRLFRPVFADNAGYAGWSVSVPINPERTIHGR